MTGGLAGLVVVAVLLGGCAATMLRHPETGATARCGTMPVPPWYSVERAAQAVEAERACIERYRQQGYVTVGG